MARKVPSNEYMLGGVMQSIPIDEISHRAFVNKAPLGRSWMKGVGVTGSLSLLAALTPGRKDVAIKPSSLIGVAAAFVGAIGLMALGVPGKLAAMLAAASWLLVSLIILFIVPNRFTRRALRTRQGKCRACGYDLAGETPAVTVLVGTSWMNGGPVICSECGSKMPVLLPFED